MADFSKPFATDNVNKRFPNSSEKDDGFECGAADQALFNGMFYRIESEIGAVITDANIPQTNDRHTLLNEAISEKIRTEANVSVIDQSTPPASLSTQILILKQPHLRMFVWSGAAYVRAPWHQPAQLGFFAHNNAIPGWLPARGDVTYDQADYPDLCAALGLSGTGTFSVVELRGEFIRCLDNGRYVDINRAILSAQSDAIRNITGRIAGAVVEEGSNATGAFGKFGTFPGANNNNTDHGISFDASRVVPTANENRPRNTAFATHISI